VPEEALAKVPDDLATLIRGTSPEAWVANWSYDIDPLPRLHEGRAVIIGDAAHAMSSSQARGMTAGLEDAVSLAVALASVPPDGLPLPAALERVLSAWAQERLPVVHGYQTRSRAVSSRTGRKRPPQVLGPIAFPAPTLPSTATQT
jgi:2-polyprenyl-6-methoxyphenol hydroxylase-like FAD-dependent oxidoreductase